MSLWSLLALLVMIRALPFRRARSTGTGGGARAIANRSADRFSKSGFAQAGEQYARIAADHPDDYSQSPVGRIALLSTTRRCQELAGKAIVCGPVNDPKVMLAEVYYRRDDFRKRRWLR